MNGLWQQEQKELSFSKYPLQTLTVQMCLLNWIKMSFVLFAPVVCVP